MLLLYGNKHGVSLRTNDIDTKTSFFYFFLVFPWEKNLGDREKCQEHWLCKQRSVKTNLACVSGIKLHVKGDRPTSVVF